MRKQTQRKERISLGLRTAGYQNSVTYLSRPKWAQPTDQRDIPVFSVYQPRT
jgi:hypothetical protein